MEDQSNELPYKDDPDIGNQVPLNHDDSSSAKEIDKINRRNRTRSIINIKEEKNNNRENNNVSIEHNNKDNNTDDLTDGERNEDTVRKRFKVGTLILKDFNGTTFRGIISRRFDGMYYKITYSDGDQEEMDHEEVKSMLENKNADNYETEQGNAIKLVQTNMHGFNLSEKDSEVFGHNHPKKPFENSSIITFQNVGQLFLKVCRVANRFRCQKYLRIVMQILLCM